MAKKDKAKKKDRKGSDAADAVEAVRSAVERTFQATSEGAAGTQKRTRALVDEVAHAAARIRETIEELRLLEDVKGLRGEIQSLARRVAALEGRGAKRAASTPSAPSSAAAAKPKRRPAKRAAAKRASTARRASTAKRPAKARSSATAKAKSSPRAKAAKATPSPSSS
jgi:hypothetical protein